MISTVELVTRTGMEGKLKIANQLGEQKPITVHEPQIHKQLDADQQKNKKEWMNLFAGNNLLARGMNLKFVTPMIKEGENMNELDSEEVDRETAK